MTDLLATEATAAGFVQLDVPPLAWVGLVALVVTLLLVDLLLVHRTAHDISVREALTESAVWIALSIAFGLVVGAGFGWDAAGEWFGGYLIEKSLSIDNVFVWAVIFAYFGVPNRYQFRVLFWGVFGALVLRAVFVLAGVALLDRFGWLLYVFGGLLLVTAYRLLRSDDEKIDPAHNPVIRFVHRFVPSTTALDGHRLFTHVDGRRLATPLFTVLLLVEATDVVFAVDSVPAILAISREPFIVISSNAFAILGLRALYFALAGMKDRFRYLDEGLAAILAFVGCKMLLLDVVHVPTPISVAVIAAILAVAITVSLVVDARIRRRGDAGGGSATTGPPTPAAYTIRDATRADLPAVRTLNAANVPEVGELDADRELLFLTEDVTFWVAEIDGALVALFVGMMEHQPYASANYRWFAARYERFAYVDRIALAPAARGTGLADELYERWERTARAHGAHVVCAEVNTVPPNPRSLRFHERRGFEKTAETAPYGGHERVAMLVRPLAVGDQRHATDVADTADRPAT